MTNLIACEHCGTGIEIPPEYDKPFAYCPRCQKMSKTGLTPALVTKIPEELPETMKANRALVGRICPVCLEAIQLGVPVHNCPFCREASHQDCWNRRQGCGNPSCGKNQPETLQKGPDMPTDESPPLPDTEPSERPGAFEPPPLPVMESSSDLTRPRTIPCRWCREPIPWNSRRCPVCQEMQRDSERPIALQARAAEAEVPGINRLWGIGIMLVSLMMFLGFLVSGIIMMGSGESAPGAVVLIFSVLSYVLFRAGQGMFIGERMGIYIFCVCSAAAFFPGLALLVFVPPAGISYLFVFSMLFAPPLVSAFLNWDKFHA